MAEMKFLILLLSFSSFAQAEVTVEQAREIACHQARLEKPPTFLFLCDTQFRAPSFVTPEFFLFQGYDEDHDCTIDVHVYRADGRPVVHSECD